MNRLRPPTTQLPGDIQKLVTKGFGAERSRHLILSVQKPGPARQFLHGLCTGGWLAGADQPWDESAKRPPLSVGITFAGLQKLGLDERLLDVLRAKAPAFAEGAWARATAQLGDIDKSAPPHWDPSFKPAAAHLLLILHANTLEALEQAEGKLKQMRFATAFDKEWARHDAMHLTTDPKNRTVHFGMRDGLSNPKILPEPPGPGEEPDPVKNCHRLGEFVLGYDTNDVPAPWRLAAERPESSGVPVADQSRALADFFKNGSFAALRKIEQDEPAFREFVHQKAVDLQGAFGLQKAEAYIRAKLLGRWEDGQVVRPSDTVAGPKPQREAERESFSFGDDKAGQGCPFGAHIRRMNPRDDPVMPSRRRPILRRGMPYGATYDRDDCQNEGESRGLLGLFFCTSLEHQFEHLVGQWANDTPMGPDNRGNARDPLIGHNDEHRHVYDIPLSDTTALALRGLKPFVRTRGTLYAFFPSLSAVRQLANAPSSDHDADRPYPCEQSQAKP